MHTQAVSALKQPIEGLPSRPRLLSSFYFKVSGLDLAAPSPLILNVYRQKEFHLLIDKQGNLPISWFLRMMAQIPSWTPTQR